MATLNVIRRWALRDQMSIREISRRTGLARNTVKKHLRSEESEPSYQRRATPSKLDPLRREAGHLAGNRGNKITETAAHFEADPHRLSRKRRKPRTYPHREHLLLTKSVGQNSMENSGQTSAEFNTNMVSTETWHGFGTAEEM